MHDEKVAAKAGSEVDGRRLFISFGVVLWKAHVAFLVNGVVEALIGNGGYRDTDGI
jgi:hypothetical protein